MLNIKNKQNNITPQLVYMWENSHDLWETKHCRSTFIYANPFFCQRLNLSENSDIIEFSASELPLPIAKYEDSGNCINTLFDTNKAKDFSLTCLCFTKIHRPKTKRIYPIDFKMHRDGKGVNPREHSKLCDWGERVQPTKRQLER
ncbi:hypothetical protein [Photorhabdus laumondii]|uniref:hypothetical protein n=1 Tax=Photorhabdus laumondii TaxID=2218628 RepID=UPI003315608E